MATTKKKTTKKEEIQEEVAPVEEVVTEEVTVEEPKKEEKAPEVKKEEKRANKTGKEPKYKMGSIVYIRKDADADLNGFKLFPQYKKYTYTIETYNENTGVYTLRRLNLSLRLPEDLIVSPDERAHDEINRRQF